MSTPTSDNRTSTWVGIAVGALMLGLVAVFAIALPKAADAESGEVAPAVGDLELPDTLPGGYTASDLPEAFTGDYAGRAEEVAEAQQDAREHGDRVLSDVLGEPAVTRTYASKDLRAVFVQAFRAEGGAFAPDSLPDPSTAAGQSVPELVAVGDAACIVSRPASQTGAPADESAPPQYAQCQLSEGELTVQVGAQGLQPEDMVGLADHVMGLLQDQ